MRPQPQRRRRDWEPGVITAATRECIDVRSALKAAQALTGEPLARELVRIVLDADRTTITAILETVARVDDELLRARTLFSVLGQAPSKFVKALPTTAQNSVIALIEGISDESARAAALQNMPAELPPQLTAHLAALGESIGDPLRRLIVTLHFENEPDTARQTVLIEMATAISGAKDRGEALAEIAPRLGPAELEQVYTAAQSIQDPDVACRALVRIAHCFPDQRRPRAHAEILELSSAIRDAVRKFDVLAALYDLAPDRKANVQSLLFDLAVAFDDAGTRCRAMFIAGGFADDEAWRNRAFLAGIAAAECVPDEHERSELFLLLRPGVSSLPTSIRRELTRAVERVKDAKVRQNLYGELSRFFVYEGPREQKYDLFISYSSKDEEQARCLANELESRGMRVFLSANAIDAAVGSASWTSAIDEALVGSRALLVLITENALRSKWVAEEWGKYYQRIVETGSGRMFSLRLSGPPKSELPLTLLRYQVLDSETGLIEPGHLTRILDILQGS